MEVASINLTKVNPQDVPYYSEKDIAYQTLDPRYENFYRWKPDIDTFHEVIKTRKKFETNRDLLVLAANDIYKNINKTDAQISNIRHLESENTFTIITAHQPVLFTGPLYIIYKIISAIKLTQMLKEKYPEYHFVPVFISGSEDHDFDEIKNCHIYGKTVSWENTKGGAVGRIPISELENTIQSFNEILGNSETAEKVKGFIEIAKSGSSLYKEFNLKLINQLFAEYGLIVFDMDRPDLKKQFLPYMKRELLNQPSENIIQKTQERLEEMGLSNQAFPRGINMFYLTDGGRNRIERDGENFVVIDKDISFTREEIINELEKNPEYFSPNVVMRPIYQEIIFPNLAYIGGGGEIAYWLERKDQFDDFSVPFPMLIRRNSAMLIDSSSKRLLHKVSMQPLAFFPPVNDIINNYIAMNADTDFELHKEKEKVEKIFDNITELSNTIDPTISKWIQAEKTKQAKLIDQIESRLKRAIKKQEETSINQIRKIKEKLFPFNSLQERKDNFFQYYLMYGDDLIPTLIETFNPMDNSFDIIELN